MMRGKLWRLARAKHPDRMILTRWLIVVRFLLYPVATIYFKMGETRGYQWEIDTWMIDGVRYSGGALKMLANAQGETYRITRSGECVTLERVV